MRDHRPQHRCGLERVQAKVAAKAQLEGKKVSKLSRIWALRGVPLSSGTSDFATLHDFGIASR